MSSKIAVDGICGIDDIAIRSYFLRFGARITGFESYRQLPTKPCCFALISFASPKTVNSILNRRPHLLNQRTVLVKRLTSSDNCLSVQCVQPVDSLFISRKGKAEFSRKKVKTYLATYGSIKQTTYDDKQHRLFVQYDDYDCVDQLFANKAYLPFAVEMTKNILDVGDEKIKYYGTCHLDVPVKAPTTVKISEKPIDPMPTVPDKTCKVPKESLLVELTRYQADLSKKQSQHDLLKNGQILDLQFNNGRMYFLSIEQNSTH
jgi:hypothetical protein